MSKREDILDGRQFGVWTAKYGLLYTCNAGWIDLGSVGCHTIFLMPNDRGNALHEHVHAALDMAGIDTRDHGPIFDETLAAARVQLRAK